MTSEESRIMKNYESVRISRSIFFSLLIYFAIFTTYKEKVKHRKDIKREDRTRERERILSQEVSGSFMRLESISPL
jgi:hypothetical protein